MTPALEPRESSAIVRFYAAKADRVRMAAAILTMLSDFGRGTRVFAAQVAPDFDLPYGALPRDRSIRRLSAIALRVVPEPTATTNGSGPRSPEAKASDPDLHPSEDPAHGRVEMVEIDEGAAVRVTLAPQGAAGFAAHLGTLDDRHGAVMVLAEGLQLAHAPDWRGAE